MQPDTRIAVIEAEGGRLLAAVRALPVRCEAARFPDVGHDMSALLAFRPDILLCATTAADEDFAGMVRVARSALGQPPVILVTHRDGVVAAHDIAQRVGARVLVEPERAGALAAALERTLAGADPQLHSTFLEIVRGLADELNNPLMYLSGHLQLLSRALKGDPRSDQLTAAQAGVRRVVDTVDRLRMVVEAETGTPQPLDLSEAVRAALRCAPSAAPLRTESRPGTPDAAAAPITVAAVPALAPALTNLAQWLQAWVEAGGFAEPTLIHPPRPGLRIDLSGDLVQKWNTRSAFAPYGITPHLSSGKDSPHGLTLFLVRTAVHASGGMTVAHPRPAGGMVIELLWP